LQSFKVKKDLRKAFRLTFFAIFGNHVNDI
jgi:hypothetical protein